MFASQRAGLYMANRNLSRATASSSLVQGDFPRRTVIFQALAEMSGRPQIETLRRSFEYVNLFGFCVIVGQEYAVMLHRFQKFHSQLEPGLNFKIPFIDSVNHVHDLREQVIEIPPQ